MRKQNDTLWKGILEPFFRDFLRFIDPVLALTINADREIVFMDKELHQEFPSDEGIYEQRTVDKLVKLYTHEGREEWILLHLEVQDKYTRDFSQRTYNYFNRLYDKYKKPITAYSIFTEPNGIKRTNAFKINCNGTSLIYKFNPYKIAVQDNDYLMQHGNPFALIILIAKATTLKKIYKDKQGFDHALLEYKLKIARSVLDRKLPERKEKLMMNFLFFYISFELSETKVKFDHEINLLTNKNINNMTIEEILIGQAEIRGRRIGEKAGKREGKREAKQDEITRLITKHGFTDKEIVDFAEVPLSLVRKVRSELN
ncbi:RpnC/YadD family protein [Pedobacter hartonius]|uniref:Transposase (putative) YhgA-like domain-containing protein n=1 Tax=Pedobacter hartonius TaxID=425514 RepID=A0A1H4BI07_9SPHI|nr:hypothetical protein [Pedobacter hartonius]SEA47845.1 hypothetical protein SAMN05443550_103359 [Pedobacter hartonius]